ncbi:hypothetical protein A2996_03260 [Candidatus Campbellbacteria bacterium RIFCSPLOWO2_01_FULL_34_15]|uniref:Uncharacterized protein n=2 Tax=Candidatus Campbelliibacteriota TaxID=1752727 RepID=A0A1F5EPU0_9BACT|nr:MAG: hypothetical protein A2811_03155 [Candidatus Campbellbacteria bacterium RIFCSPHIGHO2_01_FULL_34_10]OGD69340.1 MAG: hypothetical protein A2996_03260 [Candidatus Campbellbacteria bacterium RIFCSPLOWO2_01_FULL_34_15]
MAKSLVGIQVLESLTGWKMIAERTNETEEAVQTGQAKPAEFRIYRNDEMGLEIHVRRSLVKEGLDFLPGMVKDVETGKDLWSFFQEQSKGLGHLLAINDEVVIGLEEWGDLKKVIPVADLKKQKTVVVDGVSKIVGGRGVLATVDLKHSVAEALSADQGRSIKANITDAERAVMRKLSDARKASEERERLARETARRERIAKIKSRQQISGMVVENGRGSRWAIPVTEDEWMSFGTDDGMVAIVAGFGEDGKPIVPEDGVVEAFFIQYRKGGGGRPEKKAQVKIRLRGYEQAEPVKEASVSAPTLVKLETVFIEVSKDQAKSLGIDSGFQEVSLTDAEGISTLRKAGLNSGALVAISATDGSDRIQVEKFVDGQTQTLGLFNPITM